MSFFLTEVNVVNKVSMLRYDLDFYRTSLTTKGTRIALRAKVNDTLITGISLVDHILPIGRGQRQLILGDR